MDPSDRQLVETTIAGNRDAFRALYDRYAGVVRAICFEATGNSMDAQDVAQDVFLQSFKKLLTLRDPDRFGPWIVGMARLAGRHWRRTRARDKHRFVAQTTDDSAAATGNVPAVEMAELHAAMLELSEQERTALHVFYLEAQPAELARSLLGLSLSGFYRVLDRARQKLRKRLRDNEGVQR